MAKYAFKVYLKNGSYKKVIFDDMERTDLFDMDRYVVNNGGYFGLVNKLVTHLDVSVSEIEKITILRLKKEIEFSIISHNSYLKPVLNNLEQKQILGYGNYFIDATVVPTNHESYQDMKEYLFKHLQGDYQGFLKNIYRYDNEFSKLLHRYSSIYHQPIYSEEDAKNIRDLELRIETELSIYKNYRGLCLAREQSENYRRSNFPKNKKVSNLEVKPFIPSANISFHPLPITQEQANRENSYVNDLGEEKEEFLDPEEIEKYR